VLRACLIASALGFAGPISADAEKLAAGLLAAFEANRASLAVAGTLHFQGLSHPSFRAVDSPCVSSAGSV